MRACLPVLGMALATCMSASAQFDLEDSHSTASLRGIDALGAGIAWASGNNGTVLRTEDGGYLWQTCAMPPESEKLDFRGVQAFDAMTAVVMSSGPGRLSKVYKTTDGCQSWKLVFDDPDEGGFFDSLRKVTDREMYLLGDPVGGTFAMFYSPDRGDHWIAADDAGRDASRGMAAFAASNSSLASASNMMMFGTSATPTESAKVYRAVPKCVKASEGMPSCGKGWTKSAVPVGAKTATNGIYSLGTRASLDMGGKLKVIAVAVGGTHEKPSDSHQTAAFSTDGGEHWTAAKTMPAGYRSGVAYDVLAGRWIAVGPTGTDESLDDGLSWSKVQPAASQPASVNEGWNAVSLPFVVGRDGRIGKLREASAGK